MARNYQRLSQLITTFGPGSMVDLPTRSVIIGGLEQWEMAQGTFTPIEEPRLVAALQRRFQGAAQDPDRSITLRTPPVANEVRGQVPAGVGAFIFPTWFVCERVAEVQSSGSTVRRRRMVRWDDLDVRTQRFRFEDGEASEVTPIRFVGACEKGHIQDINWKWTVHQQQGDPKCQEAMWMQEKGTSADPSDTEIVCDCGARLSLEQLFAPKRLGRCQGRRPWLGADDASCDKDLRLLTRTATNTYFAQVATVISLPTAEDALTQIVQAHFAMLSRAIDPAGVAAARMFNEAIAAALQGYSDGAVFQRIQQLRQEVMADANRPLKFAEFDFFSIGRPEFGENSSRSHFFAQTLDRARWDLSGLGIDLSCIESVVAIHRLREVSCLYGFTRFEAAPTPHDGNLEEIVLAVDSAPLAIDAPWFPAIEQLGEGIFLKFSSPRIEQWFVRAQGRTEELAAGFRNWQRRFAQAANIPFPGASYVMLHSLAHALMTEISLECGYPASALKERVYALTEVEQGHRVERHGVLIYTATAGSKGTLGGLVELAPQIGRVMAAALERMRLCSSDPVCTDHSPSIYADDRALHGAACHGCLFVAETSCEMRNQFLDRRLLAQTIAGDTTGFFT